MPVVQTAVRQRDRLISILNRQIAGRLQVADELLRHLNRALAGADGLREDILGFRKCRQARISDDSLRRAQRSVSFSGWKALIANLLRPSLLAATRRLIWFQ